MFHFRLVVLALRGLQQNFLRSLLATLGVIIGVGAVVSAVSILEGLQKDVLSSFESLGADQLMIFNGSQKHGGRDVSVASLVPNDAEVVVEENEDLVVRAAPQYQSGGQIKYYERNLGTAIMGTTKEYAELNDYEVVEGRFLTREDIRSSGAMVCVLGYKIRQELFGALPAIGKAVKINSKSFIVVGTMEEKGAQGIFEMDRQVIIPLSTAMGRMFGSRHLTMLSVQCNDVKAIPACIEKVKRSLRRSHRIRAGTKDDFTVFTQEQVKQQVGQFAKIFAVVFYSIASISMIVGAIGIMNIMLVSVTERTREIGVRIAVGARRFDILRQFLTEASIISMFGGLIGIGFGVAISSLLQDVTQQLIKPYTPPSIVVIAVVMAVVVGIVSGIYPAMRAARLDPVQSLRFE